jgi:hypothetical protein
MAEQSCVLSRAPHRKAAKALARSRTDRSRRPARSIPYTVRDSRIRSSAQRARAADLEVYTVPSALRLPSLSPYTGDRRGRASHCIQSQAASNCQLIPRKVATSRYRVSWLSSGPLAVTTKALSTERGMCAW